MSILAPAALNGAEATPTVGRAPPSLLDDAHNLAAFLRFQAEHHPERVALRFGDVALSYGALDEQGGRLGEVLATHGVGVGSRVLIMVPVSPMLYPLLFGVMAVGACAVIVDPTMRRTDLRAALRQARVDVIVGVARAHLLRLLPELWGARPYVVGPVPRGWGPLCGLRLDVAAESLPRGTRPITPVDVDGDALMTFTTGSTGAPKGARRSHRQLNAQGAIIDARYPRRVGDVDLATLPVFATTNLAAGITTVFPSLPTGRVDLDDAAADVVWEQLVREGVSTFGGSPAFVGAVARAGVRRGVIVPRVQAVAVGGAPVSPSVCLDIKRAFPAATLRVVYGATEAEPIASVDGDDVVAAAAEHDAGGGFLVGAPDEAIAVYLDPIAGATDDSVGEVCVAGPHVLDRYVDDGATAAATLHHNGKRFLRTGDVARRDPQGRLWLLGRRREIVRRHTGQVLFPLVVEGIARARGVEGALVDVGGRATLAVVRGAVVRGAVVGGAVVGGDVADAFSRVSDLVDDVVTVDALPLDPRHRARVDRRRLQHQLSRGE